ncbi:MAG: hypothetical protein ACK55Z_28120 [bacterium]
MPIMRNAASLSGSPLAFCNERISRPVNSALPIATKKPSPACSGVRSSLRSFP